MKAVLQHALCVLIVLGALNSPASGEATAENWQEDPFWGWTYEEANWNNWRYAYWMGYFYEADGGWVYRMDQEVWWWVGGQRGNNWIYDPSLGWIWGNEDHVGELYVPGDEVWLTEGEVDRGSSRRGDRNFVEKATGITWHVSPREYGDRPIPYVMVIPRYPSILKQEGVSGEVRLEFSIDKMGEVMAIEVVSSDHRLFSNAALDAAERFRFTPAHENGEPVPYTLTLPFAFKLN